MMNINFTLVLRTLALLVAVLCFVTRTYAASSVRITASLIPAQKIEVNAVFAVHCQIWGLEEHRHRVEIFKIANQRSYPLSVGTSVVDEADERILLAVRYVADGSVVYFLTVTEASKVDEAEYSCKVIELYPTFTEVASDSVDMMLTYFPSNSYPICKPNSDQVSAEMNEGEILSLSCYSETGNPTVIIGWKKDNNFYSSEERTEGGKIYADLNLKLKASDNGAVFVCEISSNMFPLHKQTCHYGPVSVVKSPKNNVINIKGDSSSEGLAISTLYPSVGVDNDSTDHTKCYDECKEASPTVIYWIITTIIACVLAFIFLIFIIVLLMLKVFKTPEWDIPDYHEPELDVNTSEPMYCGDIESRRGGGDGKMYMSLVKSYPASNSIPQVPDKIQVRTPLGK